MIAPETPGEPEPGQAAHPLDLPAIAAYAVAYELDATQVAAEWADGPEAGRAHWRMIADAAISAYAPAGRDARKVLARVFSEFSKPDQHGIRHLSYTASTIARLAASAGLAPGEAAAGRGTLITEVLEALHEVFVPAVAEAFAARFEAAASPGACSSCGQRGGPYCDDEQAAPEPGSQSRLLTMVNSVTEEQWADLRARVPVGDDTPAPGFRDALLALAEYERFADQGIVPFPSTRAEIRERHGLPS